MPTPKRSTIGWTEDICSRWVGVNGYIYVRTTPSAICCLEHRLVMKAKIGRSLKPTEIVHHINGDIQDNDSKNLQVMTRAQHVRLHKPGQNLRPIGVPNELIPCACGCGHMIWRWDRKNRPRRYMNGHNQRGRTWNWGEKNGTD